MSDTKFSVIIPCYNSSKTIEKTLDSIFSQHYSNFEVIVINDGSSDDTLNILKQQENRIKIINQKNSGVSTARNKGVNHASGDWIAFCDSDDTWHPYKLSICDNVIRKIPECSFIFHDFFVETDGKILAERATHSEYSFFPIFKQWKITIPQILTKHRIILHELADSSFNSFDTYYGNAFYWKIMGNFVLPSTVIMKRDVFLKENGFNLKFIHAEDTEFFLRISKNVDFLYIDLPLSGYHRSSESLLSKNMLPTINNGLKSLILHCVEDPEIYEKYKSRVNRSVSRKYANLSYYYLSELLTNEARQNSIKSIKYNSLSFLGWSVLFCSFLPKFLLLSLRNYKSKTRKVIFFRALQ